jgi:hypothetical protein
MTTAELSPYGASAVLPIAGVGGIASLRGHE